MKQWIGMSPEKYRSRLTSAPDHFYEIRRMLSVMHRMLTLEQ